MTSRIRQLDQYNHSRHAGESLDESVSLSTRKHVVAVSKSWPGLRRHHAPWYTAKRRPSYFDMIVKLRRVLIAAQYQAEVPAQPTSEEIRAVQLARAQAAA